MSHIRAQIKRQASKAARSRLEKRSSVSGVAISSGDKPGHHFSMSFDANSSKLTGDGNQQQKELHNQPNSSSSTDSPHAYLTNQSTSSPIAGGPGNSNNQEPNTSMNLSPTQLQDDADPSGGGSGPGGTKLIGQHSSSTGGQHSGNHHSIHQKNFKQRIIALLKKFRTDGGEFDSEEQYREALERELMKAAAGRGSRAIEELLEEEIEVEEESGAEPEDWDNISEQSAPKPSLRPFFSSTTQQPTKSTEPNQQAPAVPETTTTITTTTTTTTTASSKPHNQHPISQLPMTTRKKLSHLRAQIKRQASKAARSRLEKRSSVSGVASSSVDKPGHHFGMSFDAGSSKLSGDGNHHPRELHNQPNSSSSTESPHAHLSNQSTSSLVPGAGNSNNQDSNTSMNLSPTQLQNDVGPSAGASGSGGTKLIGQHSSSSAGGQHTGNHHSIHQKNFKQRIIALLKKFRTDGGDFDSEEQYREVLERELMKAAAGRGSRAIEELLEEDIDVEEESGSDAEDWDNISESSTPKPSLRPFFSSTTLDKI